MSDTNTNLITPAMHEGELRILDTDLAKRLGFDRPRNIRNIIKRYLPDLDKLGPRSTVKRVVNGGNATEYYLNRKQAIFITAKSETAEATDITIEIIERFDAYERGEVKPALPKTYAEALLEAGRMAQQLEIAEERSKLQQAELDAVKPKADAHDYLAELPGEKGVRDAGRELKVGQAWVTKYIDGHHWSCVEGGRRKPAHYGLKYKYCRLVPIPYTHPHTGEEMVKQEFRLTRKGIARLAEIIAKLKEENSPTPFSQASA